jgi:threonyl-tRNA synthetase
LILKGFAVEIDAEPATINKKVRNAQLMQFNYMACVGDEEITVN